ncbi:MAG: phage portal protein [Acidimicrobiia bacterium]
MGWFRRKRGEVESRDITDVPWDVGAPSRASVSQERALGLTAVLAAHRHLSDQISTLPLDAFRKLENRREPMGSLPLLFRQLDDDGDLVDWVSTALMSLASRGNAVGVILERDGMAFPTAIHWLSMNDVHVDDENPLRPLWYWKGRLMDRSQLVHIPWIRQPDRILGLSPIEHAALVISSGLEAQTYGNDWFAAGGIPPGKFKNSAKKIDQKEADVIKGRLVSSIRTRKPLVYGNDWDYEPIVIPPEQAQFVETLQLNANQIATIYGIAPEEIGGVPGNSMTYQNEEHRQTRRMQDFRPWLVRLERKFSSWLPDRQYVRFNVDSVIRADLKTRHEVYRLDRLIGLLSIDEIRALEDLPPLPGGAGADAAPLGGSQTAEEPPPVSSNGNGQVEPAGVG